MDVNPQEFDTTYGSLKNMNSEHSNICDLEVRPEMFVPMNLLRSSGSPKCVKCGNIMPASWAEFYVHCEYCFDKL